MCVLPAVFSHARDVSFDIAGIQIGFVEWRINSWIAIWTPANEALIHRIHGHAGQSTSATGENRPALRNRIDLAFGIARRPKWRAIIKVATAIPLSIPAMLLDILTREPPPSDNVQRRHVTTQACHLERTA